MWSIEYEGIVWCSPLLEETQLSHKCFIVLLLLATATPYISTLLFHSSHTLPLGVFLAQHSTVIVFIKTTPGKRVQENTQPTAYLLNMLQEHHNVSVSLKVLRPITQ